MTSLLYNDATDFSGTYAPYCSYTVTDSLGRQIAHDTYPSDSFLLQYFQWMYISLGIVRAFSIQTVKGGTSNLVTCQNQLNCESAAGGSSQGIVVGTNTGAVAFADSSLRTHILHGVGVGQLQYGGSVVGQPASNAGGTSVILTRDFSNASGSGITVGETSVYASTSPSNTHSHAILRDTANILVPDGGTLTFNYELRTVI